MFDLAAPLPAAGFALLFAASTTGVFPLPFLLGCQMMVGAEFQLKQSKMSASVDSNGKVDSTLEVRSLH